MLLITPTLTLNEGEIEERFVRASGPGGQNVNKVATAVQLRFDVRRARSLPEHVRARLTVLAGRRMSAEGILIINAQRFRTQEQNRRDARDRLVHLIRRALHRPPARVPTRPSQAAQRRRLQEKRYRKAAKERRMRPRAE